MGRQTGAQRRAAQATRRQERARLAAIEKSRKERAALKAKYGSGGLPADYKETEQEAFKNAQTTNTKSNKKTSNIKSRGGVLRYPLEALTESTDYLQIDIVKYQSTKERGGSNTIASMPGSRRTSMTSNVPKGNVTKSLVNEGTILLQVPNRVQDGNSTKYGDSSMNTLVGAALGGTVEMMEEMGKKLGQGKVGEAFAAGGDTIKEAFGNTGFDGGDAKRLLTQKLASSAIGAFGGNVTVGQIMARESGQIFNPNMELLFNGPTLRNFKFSFKMTPRSQKEAEQIKLIIRTFKMNMAPKVTNGAGKGPSLFLSTPNVFELRYKSGGNNHPFLHKFKQCFLTDIGVNYTADGVYATYENKEPISMIMDLSFKELEPIYDIDYFDEGGNDLDNTVGY